MPFKIKSAPHSKAIILLWGFIDVCSIVFGYHIADLLYSGSNFSLQGKPLLAIIILSWLSSFILAKTYSVIYLKRIQSILIGLGKCFSIHISFLFFSLLFINHTNKIEFEFITTLHIIFLPVSFLLRISQLFLYRKIRSLKEYQTRYIIIGHNAEGQKFHSYLQNEDHPGFVFLGFFDERIKNHLTVGKLQDVPAYCKKHEVNQIFYALSPASALYHQLSRFADENYIHFGLVQIENLLPALFIRTYTYDEYTSVFPFQDARFSQ